MTGADRLCDALLAHGIGVCFANPGTSEMHFVAALDRRPEMRCVLGLFEGVVTGAADGYGRMADKPAATLLHTGPGLANGLANLHNARRALTPIVNVVGDHAAYHLPYDAPLTSDIDALAGAMSNWVHRISSPDDVAPAAAAAHRAAVSLPGIATLILPADAAWGQPHQPDTGPPIATTHVRPPAVDRHRIRAVADALRGAKGRCGLILAGPAARSGPLEAADRIAAATGARLFGGMFIARLERGRGRVPIERIPYPVDEAVAALADIDVLVLVAASAPVAFFAYPGKPSALTRPDAQMIALALPGEDAVEAVAALADELGGRSAPREPSAPALPNERLSGPLTDVGISAAVAQLLPEQAILIDEALTSARAVYDMTRDAPPHDFLMACTGGAIGAGPPVATGAALACPDRKVLALQADGSGLYTAQALWTQAREQLDVVTIIYANRAYAILQIEMRNVGVEQFGRNADRMLRLDDPVVDWVALANGMGVEGASVDSCEGFYALLEYALSRQGPFLIEAVI